MNERKFEWWRNEDEKGLVLRELRSLLQETRKKDGQLFRSAVLETAILLLEQNKPEPPSVSRGAFISDDEIKMVTDWLLPGPEPWKRLKAWLECKGVAAERITVEEKKV